MADVQSLAAARADRENDNTLISPAECCDDAARAIRSGERKADAALVLTLNRVEGKFDVGYFASNLKASEMLALLEVAKVRILQTMNYIPEV